MCKRERERCEMGCTGRRSLKSRRARVVVKLSVCNRVYEKQIRIVVSISPLPCRTITYRVVPYRAWPGPHY